MGSGAPPPRIIAFIGTNDVGIDHFVTNTQRADVSQSGGTDYQLDALRSLHPLGARHFIMDLLVPLQLTGMYRGLVCPS